MSQYESNLTSEPDIGNPVERPFKRSGLARLFRFSMKELLEILRDRRTIITLVLMPLLVYPLLGIIVQKFMINSLGNAAQTVYLVACESPEDLVVLEQFLQLGDSILNPPPPQQQPSEDSKDDNDDASSEKASEPTDQTDADKIRDLIAGQANQPVINAAVHQDPEVALEDLVSSGQADVAIRILNRQDMERIRSGRGGTVQFELIHREESALSAAAKDFVSERLDAVNDSWIRNFLRQRRVRLRFPTSTKSKLVAGSDNTSQTPSLLTFIPLMLVLMTMTGAVYPAIDLTAGERERGTMEILMAAPVSRMALLFGKFIAVLSVAMLTAIINLLAMMITVYTLGLDSIIFGPDGISVSVGLTIFVLLLVFAAFFSAVLLGLTSFARSFKEAQAYLIPIMLVALAPGLLSLFPGVEMSVSLAVVPLLNIVLLGRDLISGQADLALTAITFISTVLYGLLALGVAARIFGTDSMLFGGTSSWSDFFHRSSERHLVPSVPTAMLFLAVLFPSFIIIGGLVSRLDTTIVNRLYLNAAVTFALFVALPLVFSSWFHLRPVSSFLLYRPTVPALLAAVLLGSAVWTIAYEVEVLSLTNNRLDALKEVFEKMKVELQQIPLPVKLFCLAVVPAVCEEFTFRGFLMSAFRSKMSVVTAIVGTSVLFGLFHVFVRDALLFERMIPSTVMGLLLGIVCVRTGSVIPGMLLHTIHNGLLITLAHFETKLQEMGIGISEQKHLPVMWLVAAAIPIVIGIVLLTFASVRSRATLKTATPVDPPAENLATDLAEEAQ